MAQMQVILLERIESLGQMGDVVKVKMGFARNYLLPQRKAMRATGHNRAYFESRRAQLEADNLKRKGEAEAVAAKMNGARIVVIRQAGESGQLYGSVAAKDVADSLTATGFTVGKSQIVIDRPIKSIGIQTVRVALHPEVSVNVLVNVGQSDEEARQQQERFDRGEQPVVLAAERQMAAEAPPSAAPPVPAAESEPAKKKARKERKEAKDEDAAEDKTRAKGKTKTAAPPASAEKKGKKDKSNATGKDGKEKRGKKG